MKQLLALMLVFGLFSCQKESGGNVTPTPTVVQDPSAATLTLPADKELCLGGNKLNSTYTEVTFEWQAAKFTDNYDLTITNLNTNDQQVKFTTLNKMDVILEAGVPYSWFVTSKSNASKVKTNSNVWKFYLSGNGSVNLAPYPADGLIPKSGSSISLIDGKATLSWTGLDPDSNKLSYEIFIDTDINKVIKREIPANKTSEKTISLALKPGQIYYWQVKTSDGSLSSYTQVFSFRTI